MPSKRISIAVALDIGTTTIAAAGVDPASGAVIAEDSVANPQSRWGADVLSRVTAIAGDPGLLEDMQKAVIAACNGLIKSVCGGSQAVEVSVAGNPVMEHIFLGVSPLPLSRVPYKPAFKDAKRLLADDAGLHAIKGAPLFVFPLIGGFVGGDAVAVALDLGLARGQGVALAIDIGTNSEILLGVNGSIYAASAAAGPAFEAANISCGMTAQNGAIEEVAVSGEGGNTPEGVTLGVIGGVPRRGQYPPKGICGSGLIDAASMLLSSGVMDSSGRIKPRAEIPTSLSNRIIETPTGNSFVLYRSPSSSIAINQQDIRNLQNAKAAIRAGVSVLLKKAGVGPADVDRVCIAGAFGAHLKAKSLAGIGLLDERWAGIAEFTGDAALDGARYVIGSDVRKKEAGELALSTRYVPLSGSAHFEREFIRRLAF